MDSIERIRRLRDDYESSLDEAERLREEYHRAIVKLHRSGMSLREIADGLGISHQRVHQIVTPHEERPPSTRKRGIAAGGTVAVVLLAASLGVFLARHEAAPAQRTAGGPVVGAAKAADATGCPDLPDQPSVEHTCLGTHLLEVDPRTGEILVSSTRTPEELAARAAAQEAQRAQLHELKHHTREQLRAQLRTAAKARAAAKAQAAALAAAATA